MKKNNTGFTLVELLVVIAILGIIAAVGYPAYNSAVIKGKRADAVDSLMALQARMEEFYMNNDTYVGATINAAGTGTVGSNKTSDDYYTLSISTASAFGYTLVATPKATDSDCGNLTLDSLGTKKVTGTSAAKDCW